MCRAKKRPKNTAGCFLACFRSQLQRSLLVLPPLPHILIITQAIFSFDATNLIFFPTSSVLSPRTRWGLKSHHRLVLSSVCPLFLVKLAFSIKPRMGSTVLTTGFHRGHDPSRFSDPQGGQPLGLPGGRTWLELGPRGGVTEAQSGRELRQHQTLFPPNPA